MKKRLLALVSAFALTASLLPASAVDSRFPVKNVFTSSTYPDVSESDWYYQSMKLCYETDLMTGTTSGAQPAKTLSRGEAMALAARLTAILNGDTISDAKPGESWFAPYAEYLAAHGASDVTEGTSPATRQFFLELLYSAAKPLFSAVNAISALPDTTDAKILEFYNSGILTGKDAYGTFDAAGSLSRAEAAAMLARIIDPSLRLTFTPQEKPTEEAAENAADYQTELNSTAALFVNGEAISLQDYVAAFNSMADSFCAYYGSYYGISSSTLFSGLYGTEDSLVSMFRSAAEDQLLRDFFEEKLAQSLGCSTGDLPARLTGTVSEEALRAFAEETPYYAAYHILLLSEERGEAEAKHLAEEVLAQLDANPSSEVFFALLSAYNEDPGMTTNPNGYLFTSGEMVEEFESAVASLEDYQYTGAPVKTSYGYHIILRIPAVSHPDLPDTYRSAVLDSVLESNISAATITRNQVMLDQIDFPASYADYLSKRS